ncbi:phosphatidylcholine 1-acylhydrolase activity [Nesidiocoris tenuis]|uniref:Phosphatidylcholine 1-acylhydrolase activity n=2 Tax=Nesidiocoris tenuis TaxID=355587 RepID=A0ABN7AW79_9HEMI|nr:phosphatidylcholine 1-acylhydrolase activity [Nesidiocoris tenuis]
MFPCVIIVTMLLSSGADAGILDKGRDVVVQWYHRIVRVIPSWDRIVMYLFNAERHVFFTLYTRNGPSQTLVIGETNTVTNSNFNRNKKTKILVHGWLNAGDNFFSQLMKDAFLESHDYNVITVDWSWFSYSLYSYSRIAIHFVGPQVAKFVDFLVEEVDVNPDDVHILGHSLGAHIAGLAGDNMKCNVSRITGMDPAMPLIVGDSSYRLDSSDAKFVDVIHTSIYYLGVYKPTGHADFYPNGGGPLQPGCGVEIGVCTHRRSYRYYIESIQNEKAFQAVKCNSWGDFKSNNCSDELAYMGEGVSHEARGKFYLRTATKPPYGLGEIAQADNSSATDAAPTQ